MQETRELVAALELSQGAGLVAIVGGGGKSSLMFSLAQCLPGRVVMTTTTRIFAAQMQQAQTVCGLEDPGWRQRLEDFEKGLWVGGGVDRDAASVRQGIHFVIFVGSGRIRSVRRTEYHKQHDYFEQMKSIVKTLGEVARFNNIDTRESQSNLLEKISKVINFHKVGFSEHLGRGA